MMLPANNSIRTTVPLGPHPSEVKKIYAGESGEKGAEERVMEELQQKKYFKKNPDTTTVLEKKRCPVSSFAVDCVAQMLMRQKDVKDKKGKRLGWSKN